MKNITTTLEPISKGISVAFTIFFCGIIASILSTDWTWLSRSGCLIVVVGIIMAAWDIGNALNNLEDYKVSEDIRDLIEKKFSNLDETQLNENINQIKIKLIDKAKVFHRQIETTLIIIGTLVWGFGDLIGKL